MKNRIDYLDVSKGMLILFVLLQHYSSAMRLLGVKNSYDSYFVMWHPIILTFFMPCFFLISGYCSNFEIEDLKFYKKAFRQLIVPYAVFQLLACLISMFCLENECSINSFFKLISKLPYTTLWFLIALLVSKIVVFNLRKFFNSTAVVIITFLMLVVAIALSQYNILDNILCFKNGLVSSFFVAVGVFLKKTPFVYEKMLNYGIFFFCPLVAFLLLCHLPYPSFTANINIRLISIPLFVVLSLTGSFSMFRIAQLFGKNVFFTFFGRCSLIVYGIHFLPLFCFIRFYYELILPNTVSSYLSFLFLSYSSELIFCYLITLLFKVKMLRWVVGQ